MQDNSTFDVLQVPAEDFAQQLTLIDAENFRSIQDEEFENDAWLKIDKFSKAPNIVEMTRRFNHVSFWVVREILQRDLTSAERQAKLVLFIKIAKKLHDYNNMHSLMAVLSGLLNVSVYRLKRTWKLIKDKYQDIFNLLRQKMKTDDNLSAIREHLQNAKLPCIPYLGMFLTDITHLNTALKSPKGSVDDVLAKKQLVLDQIHKFQASRYSFFYVDFIKSYLLSVKYAEEMQKLMDEEHYSLSLAIEPLKEESDEDADNDEDDEKGRVRRSSETLSHDGVERTVSPSSDIVEATPNTPSRFNFKKFGNSLPFRKKTPNRLPRPSFVKGHRKTRSLGTHALFMEEFLIDGPDKTETPTIHVQEGSHKSSLSSLSRDLETLHLQMEDELSGDSLFDVEVEDSTHNETFVEVDGFDDDDFALTEMEGVLRRPRKRVAFGGGEVWAIVIGSQLRIFKKKHKVPSSLHGQRVAFEQRPSSTFDLKGLTLSVDPSTKHPCFSIFMPSQEKSWKFLTQSVEDRDAWVRALTKHLSKSDILAS